ncbi:MAG: tRNA lysidine(34) synthetase TilS [Lachnospiraceae bacterium]|nr:tRNA lysidine(34) synthetase TilS [Lachnospiraceae bacterium]
MEKKVREFIIENKLIEPGDRIVLGLSGGADSVCLFFLLLALREELGFTFFCVHVHHGLRGEEADGDEQYARQLCERYNISYSSFFYKVEEEAGKQGCSTEEMGRLLRYQCFEKVLNEKNCNKIAVAHHMADQAETVLYHLCRGSGLAGLAGMRPLSGNRIRPLLCVRKEEILQYLIGRGIGWREDYTNEELMYTRNRIRGRVIPCLEEMINPASVEHIASCAAILAETERYIEKQAEAAWEVCTETDDRGVMLRLAELKQQDIVIQKQLIFMAADTLGKGRKDLQAVHLDMVLQLGEGRSGREVWLPGGIRAVREYERIMLTGCTANPVESGAVDVYEKGEFELPDGSGTLILSAPFPVEQIPRKEIDKNEENIYTKWFDYDKIKDTLQLRTRREGDYLEFSDKNLRKKLKSYMIDSKIPREQREQIWLLADGSHILWVIGYRISEGYKIKKDTRRAIRAEIKWR